MRVAQLFDLHGQTAVVTGGSRGLGLQIAQALGEQGARVLLVARKQAELEQACAALREAGVQDADWLAADLGAEEGVAACADGAMARLGKVDILVNNAGATWGAPAQDYPLAAWDKVMNLNLRSVFLLSQALGRAMIAQRHGRIINIASIAGLAGNAPDTMKTLAYNTSKAGLINFTRALAAEWGQYGVTVNALAPGFFPSRMTQGVLQQYGAEALSRHAPLQRLGDEDDLKGAALLFASAAGKHITGQVLAVDGGVSAVLA
ncbi:SDR family oxidoreductase [Massilia sp. W12]|uniref:SDR family oxidoreductase n=1 Tax=Massilia sp. W12 TaxID=3126507 RepID=UPI0030CA8C12